jgi:hypothetical protein
VGLLEAEDPALATWLFEDDVGPAFRYFLQSLEYISLLFFGVRSIFSGHFLSINTTRKVYHSPFIIV